MTYYQVLQHLLQLKLVNMMGMPPSSERLPAGYNPNARCEFHFGAICHDVENCWDLKYKVQELLDSKAIQFTLENEPNVIQNPMPAHAGPMVNVVEDGVNLNLIMDVNLMSTPLLCVKGYLVKNGVFPGCLPYYCECQSQPEGCVSLKTRIQNLINEGVLQCDWVVKDNKVEEKDVEVISIQCTSANIPTHARPTPLTITLPSPIPYSNENVVPWYYGSDVYYHGLKQEGKPSEDKPSKEASLNVDKFAGTGRITKSCRIYSPQNVQDNADALAKAKGKHVVGDNLGSVQVNTPNVVPGTSSSHEVEELLRLIRKSDYKVINHLSQTLSKILILSLLLCSEAHKNALMKLLSSAFVPQNINVNQLEWVVASIPVDNGLDFTNSDLPLEGRNHNKALHISMECKGTTLSRVLVDNRSSLNVLPKSSPMKIDYA